MEAFFETLKDLPPAAVTIDNISPVAGAPGGAHFTVRLMNGNAYARLVRIRLDWNGEASRVPYLVKYSDNYFD